MKLNVLQDLQKVVMIVLVQRDKYKMEIHVSHVQQIVQCVVLQINVQNVMGFIHYKIINVVYNVLHNNINHHQRQIQLQRPIQLIQQQIQPQMQPQIQPEYYKCNVWIVLLNVLHVLEQQCVQVVIQDLTYKIICVKKHFLIK